jgi:large subunit ribosomal protein L24
MQKLKKGDKVKVLLGKDRGKEGAIERVFIKDGKILIPGVNVYKRHVRAGLSGNNEGGVIDVVKPINISNAALICPNCGKATRIGFEIIKGGKVRICRKCKKQI